MSDLHLTSQMSPLDAQAAVYGPRAAAWLVGRRKVRRMLHRSGAVDLVMPGPESHDPRPTPQWFRVAVQHLKSRRDWCVSITTERERVVYRVRWLDWKARLP